MTLVNACVCSFQSLGHTVSVWPFEAEDWVAKVSNAAAACLCDLSSVKSLDAKGWVNFLIDNTSHVLSYFIAGRIVSPCNFTGVGEDTWRLVLGFSWSLSMLFYLADLDLYPLIEIHCNHDESNFSESHGSFEWIMEHKGSLRDSDTEPDI